MACLVLSYTSDQAHAPFGRTVPTGHRRRTPLGHWSIPTETNDGVHSVGPTGVDTDRTAWYFLIKVQKRGRTPTYGRTTRGVPTGVPHSVHCCHSEDCCHSGHCCHSEQRWPNSTVWPKQRWTTGTETMAYTVVHRVTTDNNYHSVQTLRATPTPEALNMPDTAL